VLLTIDFTAVALHWIVGGAFVVFGLGCVFLALMTLPGAWLMLVGAGAIQLCDRWLRPEGGHTFSTRTLLVAVALAVGGELLEFSAGAAGAKRGGASRRGMVGAMIGGTIGAIVGAPFVLVVGAVVGGVVGSAIGAIVGELTLPGRTLDSAMKPAAGAAAGRLAGMVGKVAVALALWIGLSIAALVN
jgi:uncharacterized protein YqgC (DUF456 family)